MWQEESLCHIDQFGFGYIDGFTQAVCRGAPGHLLGEITVLHHIPDPVDVRIDGGVFLFFDHIAGIPEALTG